VKQLLHEAVSIYGLNTDVLNDLRPDLIITQSQCEVCAVSLNDVERAVCELITSHPKIVSLEPNGLDDVWTSIRQVAESLGVPERGQQLVEQSRRRLFELSRRTAETKTRPTIACIEWIDPLMAAGNWVPELVEIAGGTNLFGEAGKHSPWMTWEQLLERDPDVIAVMPCGWDIPRSRREMTPLTSQPAWNRLKAVQNRRVFLTDGNQYFNRPGPRLVESAEILAELLHPGLGPVRHREIGWESF
jgi:iron complex transport system substrate-binding protein